MDICIDFDGTCVTHAYPEIGKDIGSQSVLTELIDKGHRLILFTMRSDNSKDKNTRNHLTEAVNWFKENNIPLYGIQENPTQKAWTSSPKAYGQLYIDDAALGIPLITNGTDRPYVNWFLTRYSLKERGIL